MRVLLVEDDPGLAAIIKTGFAEHGVQIVTVANYADGSMKAVLGTFDVIILDVMLPGGERLRSLPRAEGARGRYPHPDAHGA